MQSTESQIGQSSSGRGPRFMVLVVGALVCAALGLFALNIYSSNECQHKSSEELGEYVESINRRLLEAESENIRNSIMMDKVLHLMQSKMGSSEKKELEEMMKLSQDEAVKITMLLAGQPDPEIPHFYIDSQFLDPERLADAVDDVFLELINENVGENSAQSNSLNGGFGVGGDDDGYTEISMLSDEEATKLCSKWRDDYSVVLGVSWGSLPINLQLQWKSNDCDYHLQSGAGDGEGGNQLLISREEYENERKDDLF